MSHVPEMEIEIKDLDSLDKACDELGLELVRWKKTFKWFGRHMGDYPLPAGFSASDIGKCEHAIRVKGDSKAYEVGIVSRRDGRPGYTALYDFWQGGFGLMDKIGENGDKLKQEYAAQVSIKHAKKKGFTVTRKINAAGEIILNARRLARS